MLFSISISILGNSALPAGHWAERADSRKNLFKMEKKPASEDTLP